MSVKYLLVEWCGWWVPATSGCDMKCWYESEADAWAYVDDAYGQSVELPKEKWGDFVVKSDPVEAAKARKRFRVFKIELPPDLEYDFIADEYKEKPAS